MSAYEFLIGRNPSNAPMIDGLIASFQMIDWDWACMLTATKVHTALKAKNQLIETPDIIIASVAITNGLPLATLNTKHFERIDGLKLYPLP